MNIDTETLGLLEVDSEEGSCYVLVWKVDAEPQMEAVGISFIDAIKKVQELFPDLKLGKLEIL